MLKHMKYRIKVIHKLIPFTAGVKRFFILNIVISLLVMLSSFINPLLYKLFINEVILNKSFNSMTLILIGYFGLFFINASFSYLKNYNNNRLVNKTTLKVKMKIWRSLFHLSFQDYDKLSIGDLKMRLDDDTGQIGKFANYQSIDYSISLLTLIISTIFIILIDWRLALFAILSIPLTFWFDDILSKKERVLNNNNRENEQKMSSWLHSSIQGWREVKALNLQKSQERQFIKFQHKYALYFGKWINYWVARVLIIPKLKDEFFMQFGLYFFGGLLIINGHLKIGDLLVFAIYYGMLSNSLKTVSSTDAELQSAMPFTNRLLEALETADEKTKQNGIIPGPSNTIKFDKVSFSYGDESNEVIQNLSLQINKGERVAITGKSGCGKTTILKLITGMLSPNSGKVLFSGINLSEIELSVMHKRIGFVMQENMLFNATIRDNLLYGKNDATDLELMEACNKAYIAEFIDSLPEGFDTIIGERGIKLSGGQKQRIILARLFLRDVDIFIFDEATSALDQYSENIVHDAIRNIAEDKTIIVVAHRESSIRLCDRCIAV